MKGAKAANGRFKPGIMPAPLAFVCVLAVFLLHPWVFSPQPAFAAFADLGAGARAPGMGNAFVAVADDVYSVYYNPAGLALLSRPELATAYTQHLTGLSDGTNLGTSFIGYAHPLREGQGGAGVSWQRFNLDGGLYQEQSLSISYGNLLFKSLGPGNLYGGINLKNLNRSFGTVAEAGNALDGLMVTGRPDPVLTAKRSMNAADIDVGFLYRLRRHYAAGLSLMHLTRPDMAFGSTSSDRLPLSAKLGLGYRSLLSNAALQYETRQSPLNGQDHRLTIGAERWFPWLLVGNLGARGALSLGSRDFQQVTAGLSYQNRRFAIDYGFSLPINTIASTAGTHRVSFSLRFGPVREAEESMELILEAMRKLKSGQSPKLQYREEGLSLSQRALLDECLADVKFLETAARYQEALGRLAGALALSPSDADILKAFGRLNFIATGLKALPGYETDPVQAAWHQGILAYLAYDDAAAVDKVSYALSLDPGSGQLGAFLTQLESATGIKRVKIAAPVTAAASEEKPYTDSAPAAPAAIDPAEEGASLAVQEGRYQDAIALSLEILGRNPGSLPAWENLAISYFAVGGYRQSLEAFEKAHALEKSPARRALLDGHIKSVRNVLRKPAVSEKPPVAAGKPAVRAPSPQAQSLYEQGLDLYSSGRLEDARKVFEQVLELAPQHTSAAKALKRVKEELRLK